MKFLSIKLYNFFINKISEKKHKSLEVEDSYKKNLQMNLNEKELEYGKKKIELL